MVSHIIVSYLEMAEPTVQPEVTKENNYEFFDNIIQKREQLLFGICKLVSSTILLLEERLWHIWNSDNSINHIVSVSWKGEITEEIVRQIVLLKRRKVDVLEDKKILVLIANMLNSYFNNIYTRIVVNNEEIPELQSIKGLFEYSDLTLLSIWAHQTANIHLAIDRIKLRTRTWQSYRSCLGEQLNVLLNCRRAPILNELCNVKTNWNTSNVTNGKPFQFMISFEK